MVSAENRWSPEDVAKLQSLQASGESIVDMAKAFPSRSYRSVRRKIEGLRAEGANGGTPNRDPWSSEEISRLAGLFDQGLRGSQIAAHFPDRTYASVNQKMSWLKSRRPAAEKSVPAPPPLFYGSAPLSITAAVFGDPLPGRSALDQRRAK